MKTTLRFAPGKDFEFVELEIEQLSAGELPKPEQIARLYEQYGHAFRTYNGIPDKDFQQALITYMLEHTGNTAQYLAMSRFQQDVIQEIKKALATIKRREDKSEDE